MPKESMKDKRERALQVCVLMDKRYPAARTCLEYSDAFTLTICVLLSAQTTDKAVNAVTPELFEKYGSPKEMAAAPIEDIERILRPIGFYRTKARHCIELASKVLSDFAGQVPSTMDELQTLPGVGRKTANIVLNEGFGLVEGIAVDTHVFRIAHRLRFSRAKAASQTEKDLLRLLPHEKWGPINRQWVLFGREVCTARKPKCDICELAGFCPSCEA